VTCFVVRLQEVDATCTEVSLQGQYNFDRRDAMRRHEGRHQYLYNLRHMEAALWNSTDASAFVAGWIEARRDSQLMLSPLASCRSD
jgi:hypothetical protein